MARKPSMYTEAAAGYRICKLKKEEEEEEIMDKEVGRKGIV